MAKNNVVVRTAQDLERKYNFASLIGLKSNVEITSKGLTKIENELADMLNSLYVNLKDVLDDQREISLWFYSGIPTLENSPYIDWENKNDHIGDIYYDKLNGNVYQFNGTVWEVNTSPDLVEAMAITNSETDTSLDHERKVFFYDQPTIPYSNGDWWLKESGELFICQISKDEGEFEKNDFTSCNNYTESIAKKIGDELTVLKGTVTTITDNYAKFTDLATGGSTTISGDNITTGNIESNNYVPNLTGMKIALDQGTIDSANFKTDTYGNVYLGDGAKIIGGDGMITNLQYTSGEFKTQFATYNYSTQKYKVDDFFIPSISVYIPNNFKIQSANVELFHIPSVIHDSYSSSTFYGYMRNIKLYKTNNSSSYVEGWTDSEISYTLPFSNVTEISGAFGTNGWTPSASSSTNLKLTKTKSIDIKNSLIVGDTTTLVLKGALPTTDNEMYTKCGCLYAVVNIIGYLTYS